MVWATQKTANVKLSLRTAHHSGFVVIEDGLALPVFAGTLAECLAYMGGRHLGPEHRIEATLVYEPIPTNRADQ